MQLIDRTVFVGAYTFADYFDRTVKMLRYTWKSSLAASLAVFVPIAIVSRLAYAGLFGGIAKTLIAVQDEPDASDIFRMLAPVLAVLILSAVFGFARLFVTTVVTVNTVRAAYGVERPEEGNFILAWRRYFGTTVLAVLIRLAIVVGAVALAIVPIVILFGVAAATAPGTIPAVAGATLLYIATICFLVWLSVSLFLSPQAIVFDDSSAFASLERSARLTRGRWWRLFGLMLLLNLIYSFAAGLVTGPIVVSSLLPFISDMIRSGAFSDDYQNVTQIFEGLAGASTGFAIAEVVQSALYAFVVPVFWSLYYIDMKSRAGDYALPLETAGRDPQ